MAWTIKRLESPVPDGVVSLVCDTGLQAARVYGVNTADGATQTIDICYNPNVAGCDHDNGLLYLLSLSGTWTPADWDDECGA